MRVNPKKLSRFLLLTAFLFLILFAAVRQCHPKPSAAAPVPPSASPLPSAAASPARTPDPTAAPVPWNLVLVNRDHPVDPEAISGIRTVALRGNQAVDERCYPELQQMMDDCRAAGYAPVICSSFRTYRRQEEIFARQVSRYIREGLSAEEAREKTKQSVALPGFSEHELGLSVDITDIENQNIISGMESQPVQRWLASNCWKYGFILRYPPDKAEITGIVYEPWHYRYVGREAAEYIMRRGITLEEYVENGLFR